jgi:NTE family protein
MQIRKALAILLFTALSLPLSSQSVGLVLSGGGAKGLSHIGVIRALEENNIPIDYIAGTSMGAIVAGLYSIGLTPDEMEVIFRSREFASWYQGEFEEGYATYIYREDPSAEMLNVPVRRNEENKLTIKLPVSLVSPYPMDLAVMQIFASSAAAAEYDFDNLMVPFRCVGADIVNKKPYILRKGDLGSAIRASMTYPFLFKPIEIDSVLLFDGGFYNNFPWDVMVEDFNPDFIIGSKCSGNAVEPDTEDIVSQIENMLMVETDYTIPPDVGKLIDIKFEDVAIMDFHKAEKIIRTGYEEAMASIDSIKQRVKRETTPSEMMQKRMKFRSNTLPLKYNEIHFRGGNLNEKEQEFISKTIKNNSDKVFDFQQLKKGYYRVVATGNIGSIFPQSYLSEDSLFTLCLDVTRSAPLKLTIGGNISSSSLNQGYMGIRYNKFTANPWRTSADINLGRYYTGLNLSFRQDIGVKPLWFYQTRFTIHRFDYFGGSQTEFFTNRIPSNIQESELFFTLSAGTPLNIDKSILAKANINIGTNLYEYYQNDNFTTYDIPDRTTFFYISPSLNIERNTLNYKQYPTEGIQQELSLRYSRLNATHTPGSTSEEEASERSRYHNNFLVKVYYQHFFELTDFLNLGITTDITLSNRTDMGDHISSLLFMPAFEPNPHSRTLLLNRYKAPSYAGISLTPIFKFTRSLSLQVQGSYFQPHTMLEPSSDGLARFTEPFPQGSFMGHLALVWQSPVGPISLSATYYEKDEVKWYPQFNIGYQIFTKKALAN